MSLPPRWFILQMIDGALYVPSISLVKAPFGPFAGPAPQPASDDHHGVCGRHREKIRNNLQALYKFSLCCRRAKSKPYSFRGVVQQRRHWQPLQFRPSKSRDELATGPGWCELKPGVKPSGSAITLSPVSLLRDGLARLRLCSDRPENRFRSPSPIQWVAIDAASGDTIAAVARIPPGKTGGRPEVGRHQISDAEGGREAFGKAGDVVDEFRREGCERRYWDFQAARRRHHLQLLERDAGARWTAALCGAPVKA